MAAPCVGPPDWPHRCRRSSKRWASRPQNATLQLTVDHHAKSRLRLCLERVLHYHLKDDVVPRIRELILSPHQEDHIWTKHQVTPDEVEEVCFADPWVLRGRDNSYAVFGQTDSGRYLTIFLYPRG